MKPFGLVSSSAERFKAISDIQDSVLQLSVGERDGPPTGEQHETPRIDLSTVMDTVGLVLLPLTLRSLAGIYREC